MSMLEAYKSFCSKYPLKRLSMPKSDLVWSYYDLNKRSEHIVIFLHGLCGTAGCYFYQLDALANLGFRVISLQYPCYNYIQDWIKNVCNILEYLNIKKAHFFAADLGGYLIQLYAKIYPSKIESLILCNSYRRTDEFAAVASLRNIYGKLYSFLPHVLLKKILLENYIYAINTRIDLKEKNSLEFMSNEIELITGADLGGRFSLHLSSEIVDGIYVNEKCLTLIQTLNNTYKNSINEDMRKAYPYAKHAIMKSGGCFPYLSRHEEVNIYILVHLRNNCSSDFVKEQITSMSYIHQQKSDNIDIDKYIKNDMGDRGDRNINKHHRKYNDNNEQKVYRNNRGNNYDRHDVYSDDNTYQNCYNEVPSDGEISDGYDYERNDGYDSASNRVSNGASNGVPNDFPNGVPHDNYSGGYDNRCNNNDKTKLEYTNKPTGINKNNYNKYDNDDLNVFNIYKNTLYDSVDGLSRRDTVTSEESIYSYDGNSNHSSNKNSTSNNNNNNRYSNIYDNQINNKVHI
uniref:Maspardin n=1 Tax=Piliocolobus tephrosceles TaxID=591936 RepID=A0A8C9GRF1_9PRIM